MWLQLRDIEILVQAQLEPLEAEGKDDETLRAIQQILYSTEVRHPMYISQSDSEMFFAGRIRGTGGWRRSRRRGNVLSSLSFVLVILVMISLPLHIPPLPHRSALLSL